MIIQFKLKLFICQMQRLEDAISKKTINYQAEDMEKPQALSQQQDGLAQTISNKDKSIKKLKSNSKQIGQQFEKEKKAQLFKSGSKLKNFLFQISNENSDAPANLTNIFENPLFSKDGSSINILQSHETLSHAKAKLQKLADKGQKNKTKDNHVTGNHLQKSEDILFEGIVQQFTPSNGLPMEKSNLILRKCVQNPNKLEMVFMQEGNSDSSWSTFVFKNFSKLQQDHRPITVTISNQQDEQQNSKRQKLQIKFYDCIVANRLEKILNQYLNPQVETNSKEKKGTGTENHNEIEQLTVGGEMIQNQPKVVLITEYKDGQTNKVSIQFLNESASKITACQQNVVDEGPSLQVCIATQSNDATLESKQG